MKHEIEIVVRSYELDILGHVNNAVYLHYLEHARVTLLNQSGVDFTKMREDGQMMVIAETQLKFRAQAFMADELVVTTEVALEGIRLIFKQKIHRKSDQKLIADAVNTIVVLNQRGRPAMPPDWVIAKLT